MREKAYRQNKKRVEALIKKWVGPSGLGWQRLVFRWYDEPIPDYDDAMMTCTPRWEYHEAFINICLPKVAEFDDDDRLEFSFVHELGHVVLGGMWQMRDCEDDQARRLVEEHTATLLARMLIWTRAAGAADERRAAKAKQKAA